MPADDAPVVPADLDAWLSEHDQRIRDELFEFLRIPSVSARSEHTADVRRAADWLRGRLETIGFTAETIPTAGHPVVLAEWRKAGPGALTLLVYGHYDVQPPEPLDLWTSPAFEPTVRDDKLFARGAVDDKGQLWIHVKALEAHLATRGRLPVNVIVLAEGEEEVGSEHLEPFIAANAARLKCDAVVISDSAMFAPGVPSILSSLRGLAYFEITVQGPSSDLHSGMYGGAVVNPAMALARILSTMHDPFGRVSIEGFYDSVRLYPDDVLVGMRLLPFDEAAFKRELGVDTLGGEKGYSVLENLWARPTCEVNGLISGYTGEGAKTVLPARALAKVSCRLVPDQEPAIIDLLMKQHVAKFAPKGVTASVRQLHGGKPWHAELDGPLFDAARRALTAAFGRPPITQGEGGSIPVVGDFERILKAPVLLVGFGLPGENAHAPDEWIGLDNFRRGLRAIAVLYDELAVE
ncbi:MAG TPA: dipeptidase [Gemmatimonadaceae bacterium]|nr:dipeptidase [Gemmatimonadaceae bacterium]